MKTTLIDKYIEILLRIKELKEKKQSGENHSDNQNELLQARELLIFFHDSYISAISCMAKDQIEAIDDDITMKIEKIQSEINDIVQMKKQAILNNKKFNLNNNISEEELYNKIILQYDNKIDKLNTLLECYKYFLSDIELRTKTSKKHKTKIKKA